MMDLPTSIIINHIYFCQFDILLPYFLFMKHYLCCCSLLEDLRVEEEKRRSWGGGGDVQIPKASFFKKVKRKEVFYSHAQKLLLNFEAVNTCRTIGGHTVIWSNSWLGWNLVKYYINPDAVIIITQRARNFKEVPGKKKLVKSKYFSWNFWQF